LRKSFSTQTMSRGEGMEHMFAWAGAD